MRGKAEGGGRDGRDACRLGGFPFYRGRSRRGLSVVQHNIFDEIRVHPTECLRCENDDGNVAAAQETPAPQQKYVPRWT